MKSELTEAEQAWMLELNRIGTEEGMTGFPMHPQALHSVNCFLEDFRQGLTPREAIEHNKPYEPEGPDSDTVLKCRRCGAVNPVEAWLPADWPDQCPNCGSTEADAIKLADLAGGQ